MTTPVLEIDVANGVVYRIMEPNDVAETIACVAKAFHEGEPVTGACGCTLSDQTRFAGMYLPRMAAEGNTVLAVDKTTAVVLGAFREISEMRTRRNYREPELLFVRSTPPFPYSRFWLTVFGSHVRQSTKTTRIQTRQSLKNSCRCC